MLSLIGLRTAKPSPKMCACWNGGGCLKHDNDTYTCVCLKGTLLLYVHDW